MIGSSKLPVSLDSDIDVHHAQICRNQKRIYKWCRQYTLISGDEQIAWSERIVSDPSIKMFSVKNKGRDQVGVCGFTSIDRQNRHAEFSLWIDPASHGLGFGKQALYLLLRHGFFDWGFHRIWGEVLASNPALEMFLKIGFTVVGKMRESYFRDGKFIDSTLIDYLVGDFPKEMPKWIYS